MKGRVQGASQHGAYMLRFEGDVRLTLSASIDDYFQKMCEDPDFSSVIFDLSRAEGLDSTTLGIMAKVALKIREKFDFSPAIYSSQPGITRLLQSMGFNRLFELRESMFANSGLTSDIPMVPSSKDKMRDKVLEAHRTLMELSEENKDQFANFVTTLEEVG